MSTITSYRQKIRKQTYLWGGVGVPTNFSSENQLFATVRVDDQADSIKLSRLIRKEGMDSEMQYLGALKGGETLTVSINGCCGVTAVTEGQTISFVTVTLHTIE